MGAGSLFIIGGGQGGGLVSFTCKSNGLQCIGYTSCSGFGPIIVGGVEAIGGGTVANASNAGALSGTSYGYIVSAGPVSGQLTLSQSGGYLTLQGTTAGSVSLGKSIGGGVAFMNCTTTILGCFRQ